MDLVGREEEPFDLNCGVQVVISRVCLRLISGFYGIVYGRICLAWLPRVWI